MKWSLALVSVLAVGSVVLAGETLFSSGPQEFSGRKYYWLAEWKLEVTLPGDVAGDDRFEVLFGSKGPAKRSLSFQYDGRHGSMSEVRQEPYQWVEIPLNRLSGDKKVVLTGTGDAKVAFLAGVRISGKSKLPPRVKPIPTASLFRSGDGTLVWADLPGFELNDATQRLWNPSPEKPDWHRAERSSKYAGIALTKVQRWLHERCLAVRDQPSGLFRPTGQQWNYRDTAADCYPFYVWAAYFTDKKVLETVMLDALQAEQRLCNHLDRLPVPYDMDKGRKDVTPFDRMIFGASEYAKDGLIPIVEITGQEYPWYDRMRGLVDDIFKHARIETPFGKIPSTNIEVNGELLQLLPRLHCMTGEQKYLDWAHRLADYYLLDGEFVPSKLSDHGCEIIGGLGLLFAVDSTVCPDKCEQYKPHMEYMFDEILRRGRNSDGVIIGSLQNTDGPHDNVTIRDGWGYDLIGLLDYDLALGTQRYREAIRRPMTNLLKPRYREFNWDHGSRDNIADSVEGGLYLLHRFPTTESFVWADREIATQLVSSRLGTPDATGRCLCSLFATWFPSHFHGCIYLTRLWLNESGNRAC
ncbi:MAG TPA: hypothetical protein QF564_24180, partial [Pirellulaceae bacterium]|nr:hypothetical protein [Pirellulaceae bacterium]